LPVLFHTSSAPGILPSELSPFATSPRRFHRDKPTYRFIRRCFQPRKRRTGPSNRGSWVYPLQESSDPGSGMSTSSAGCSLGLFPLKVFKVATLGRISPAPPPTRFSRKRFSTSRTAPRSIHQSDPCPSFDLALFEPKAWATLSGFSCLHHHRHSNAAPFGLCVHLTPSRLIT
jgi:hypothetical protein